MSNLIAFDVETNGLHPWAGDRMFSFSILLNGESIVMDKENTAFAMTLEKIWHDTSLVKVGHNIKFDCQFTRVEGIEIPYETSVRDTMIMARMLRNDIPQYGLDYLAEYHGDPMAGEHRKLDAEVAKQAKDRGGFDKVDKELMHKYQVADVERTMLLHDLLWPEIESSPALRADFENEMRLLIVTQRMEEHGIRFDPIGADMTEKELHEEIVRAHELVTSRAGGGIEINVNSGDQVGYFLFNVLKLPVLKYTKGGKPSIDKEVLASLADLYGGDPMFDALMRERAYRHGLSAIESYRKHVVDGRIHTTINTNQAGTGRQSSNEPNLQNVSDVNSGRVKYPVPLRSCFRNDGGCIFAAVDYAGIEMRLIIDACGEPELLRMLQDDPDADVHYPTMECFHGVDEALDMLEFKPDEFKKARKVIKNVGFCKAYGGGLDRVASTIGMSPTDAEPGYNRYCARFPRIANFSKHMEGEIRRRGFIETSFGRRLYVSRSEAYAASNYLIQGTAAGILKRGQVRVDDFIHRVIGDRWMKMTLCIHDELIFNIHRSLLPRMYEIRPEIDRLLTEMPEIKVPLRCEWKYSTYRWSNTKEWRI